MKNLSYTLAFVGLIGIISSCKKDANQTIKTNQALRGKWKLNANFFGTGAGLPTWETVAANDNHTVVFNNDGSVGGNEYGAYRSYKVQDSLIVFALVAGGEYKSAYTIKHDTLYMSPATVTCIEGCAVRFIKQN